MPRDDSAHLQVLEATLVVLILLGALYAVVGWRLPATTHDRSRTALADYAQDALVVLDGISDANGTALELGLQEALHCKLDPAPSPTSCFQGRGANLSFRIDSYLPQGAASVLRLGNGAGARDLWRGGTPTGEAIESTRGLVPNWNLTFIMADLSCHEPGADANVTLVPIRQGNLTTPTSIAATVQTGASATAQRASEWGTWNATILGATRPASGPASAAVVAKGASYNGSTTIASCALEGKTPTLRAAVATTSLAAPRTVTLGESVALRADLASLAAVPGVTLLPSNVTIYEPIAARGTEPDSFAPLAVVPLPAGSSATANWTVPPDALVGAHPTVLRARFSITLPSSAVVELEARVVTIVDIALPGGVVPRAPAYQASLQVWFPDWH